MKYMLITVIIMHLHNEVRTTLIDYDIYQDCEKAAAAAQGHFAVYDAYTMCVEKPAVSDPSSSKVQIPQEPQQKHAF